LRTRDLLSSRQAFIAAASGDWSISDPVLVLSIIAQILIFIERYAPTLEIQQ
jgi:hypothetical protein